MRKPRTVRHLRRSVAANVRASRARLGLTQQALADATGFDLRYLQRIEQGDVNLTLESLAVLAEALHVQPLALLQDAELAKPRRGRPARGSKESG